MDYYIKQIPNQFVIQGNKTMSNQYVLLWNSMKKSNPVLAI